MRWQADRGHSTLALCGGGQTCVGGRAGLQLAQIRTLARMSTATLPSTTRTWHHTGVAAGAGAGAAARWCCHYAVPHPSTSSYSPMVAFGGVARAPEGTTHGNKMPVAGSSDAGGGEAEFASATAVHKMQIASDSSETSPKDDPRCASGLARVDLLASTFRRRPSGLARLGSERR
ncbi:hypothetical protein V499_07063 [Pseudogymnoascus sp. VKM F-103]|nr:hypothetical protein V499_07063 [Pseudogymnoascus sp. VKM F-103]